MLRRLATLAGGALAGTVILAAQVSAEPPVGCEKLNERTGQCELEVAPPPAPPPDANGGAGSGYGSDDGAVTIPVAVVNGQQCIALGLADPQPKRDNPIWGEHTDGAIYECLVAPDGRLGTQVVIQYWAADPPAAPPPPPDPEVLAQQAVASMGLSAIDIGIVPEPGAGSVGLIGMPTWMWVENPGESTTGPITRTASAGGFTVTATARLDQIVWTMGDGATVTCVGGGTPYADSYGESPSPDCGHTYTRQGHYAVSAASFWTVAWSGIGETGTIPLDFVNTTQITMGEAQVITQ